MTGYVTGGQFAVALQDIIGTPCSLDAAHVALHSVHVVTKLSSSVCCEGAGIMYECDCIPFYETACCKHVLCIGLHFHDIQMPAGYDAAWFADCAGHRNPGRPTGSGRQMPPAFVVAHYRK